MPLNVKRICTSVLLVLFISILVAQAQTTEPSQTVQPPAPTSGDVMRDRISKAKAFIVVRNYNAAIYELENIRRETADTAVQGVVSVLLMNSYLEQGDYKRAQDFLNQSYNEQKTSKPNAAANYMSVAGQVVKGARSRAERYRALGLAITDRTLPLEALNDLDKMRETLEIVVTQSKELGKNTAKTNDAMALLEEATNSRTMIARDDYDAKRWKDEVADTREEMVNSRSVVANAVDDGVVVPNNAGQVAASTGTPTQPVVMQPIPNNTQSTREREVKSADTTVAKNEKQIIVSSAPPTVKEEPKKPADTIATGSGDTIDVGSLVAYATAQPQPVYPSAAKSLRTTGIVKVEVTVNESGDVSEVQKTSGPMLLQDAAKNAIKKWKFKPFVKDGQPVKATGFVNFNFSL
ncbi:MAG: energy transducer TonB [Pyrinomonadaceae bacterium]|nr:energy transducer TonB [Pyrinomonadaceae bacterium]